MKCLLLNTLGLRHTEVPPVVCSVTALYQCHWEQSWHSLFEIPLAAECFRGSNTPNLVNNKWQLSLTSLTCNYWPELKASFFSVLHTVNAFEISIMPSVPQISRLLCVYPKSEWLGLSVTLWRWYVLCRTMPQTDEGYNTMPILARSFFRVILFSVREFF